MKINKLHIDNFGRLQNISLDFSGGLNQFFNENGWGKTTLAIFVKSMFYGMGAARDNIKNERKKYMPWQGGNFGGFLEFSCDKGKFRIVRSFGKTPEADENQLVDLATNKQIAIPKEGLGEWLFGVGKETFEMTAFFPQLDFLSGVNEQISAGVLGLEKFKFDLANVGQAMTKIKKETAALKKNTVKQGDIDRLKRQINELQLDLSEAERALKNTHKQIEEEKRKRDALEKEFSLIKEQNERQEKIFASKIKIENEIKQKNEELAALLLSLNSADKIAKEKTKNKKSPVVELAVMALFAAVGLVLGITAVISWLIAGIICGCGLILGCIMLAVRGRKVHHMPAGDEGKEIDENIKNCQNELATLKANLANFEGIVPPDKKYLEEKQEQLFGVRLSVEHLAGQYQNLELQRERLLKEIEGISDEMATIEEQRMTVQQKMEILQYTYDFLSQAKENVSSRFVGPINAQLKEFLQRFDMRGREYVVDTNFDIKESDTTGLKPFEQSSQGYQDILSFAMRFLLIKQVFKGEKPFIILDDCFVNLDEQNFVKASEILGEFAREYQILYICCNGANKIKEN